MSHWYTKNPEFNYNNERYTWCDIGVYKQSESKKFRVYAATARDDHDVMAPAGEYQVKALKINGRKHHSLIVCLPKELGVNFSPYAHQAAANPEFTFFDFVERTSREYEPGKFLHSLIVDGEIL